MKYYIKELEVVLLFTRLYLYNHRLYLYNPCTIPWLVVARFCVFRFSRTTLPWLVVPMINNRYLKRFLMPYRWHGHGTGHIIRVGGVLGLSKASFAILSMLTTISVARENVQSSSKEPSFISPRQYVR